MKERNVLNGKAIKLVLTLAIAVVFGAVVGFAPGVVEKSHASQYPSETIDTNTGAHSYNGAHFTINNGEEHASSNGIAGKKLQ